MLLTSHVEAEMEEAEEEEELLSEIEVEQAPPVVPIPAPVEPPVKRKRGRPPKNKPDSKCQTTIRLLTRAKMSPVFPFFNSVKKNQTYLHLLVPESDLKLS